MKGTFAFCRTKEAIKRLHDGDTLQNLESGMYFKNEASIILTSSDLRSWEPFEEPLEVFPPYVEWRSILNLHYHKDLEGDDILYLTEDDEVVSEEDAKADKSKKRWFRGGGLW